MTNLIEALENYKRDAAIFAKVEAEFKALKEGYEQSKAALAEAKEFVNIAMLENNIDKYDENGAVVSYRKSVETIVKDLDALPEGCYKIVKQADKVAIKARIQDGGEVAGAELSEWQNIQIKFKF